MDGEKAEENPSSAAGSDGANRRRERPRLSYTEDFTTPTSVTLDVIGVVRSPYKERFGTPRQPPVTAHTLGNAAQEATIELHAGRRLDLALRGLAGFEFVWVVSYFHLNQGWNPLVRPPRGPKAKQGVLATRSPHHPNPVGLSCLRVVDVDEKRRIVRVRGADLLDGTPVLDIKPYVPYCDAFPDAKSGWLDELEQDMKAPDALSYYPPPAHLMHAIEEAKGGDAADDSATCDANGQGNDQGQKTCEQRCQTAGEPTGQ